MRNARRTWLALVAVLVAAPAAARAQGDTGRRGEGPPGMMRGRGAERMRIQREIRQAFTRAVRNQVGLDDDQMRKLAPINRTYAQQRQALAREERGIRMALRDELSKAQPDQDSVAKLSDRLQALPRRRLDLNDAEDRELSAIMTPVQLAKYRALVERVQHQLNMMRPPMMGGDRPPPDSTGR